MAGVWIMVMAWQKIKLKQLSGIKKQLIKAILMLKIIWVLNILLEKVLSKIITWQCPGGLMLQNKVIVTLCIILRYAMKTDWVSLKINKKQKNGIA